MMSSFTVLFFMAIVSIALHRSFLLKPLALLAIIFSFYFTYYGAVVPLEYFSSSETIRLFELILEIVLFAVILHEKEDITITQTLFISVASILLLQSDTLMSFVLSFEALSIISVVLVSFIKTKEQANGAMKMFIAGSIATGFLFLGVALYVIGGGVLLEPLVTTTNYFQTIGIFIMLFALFYKITIVPFHSWAIDTYALVRPSHTAILSGIAKTVAVLAMFKFFAPFLQTHIEISIPLLATLSILTMTLGNFLALHSTNLAKILTYSSIAQSGYMLLAFVSVESSFAKDGILYMSIAYIFMQTAVFLALDILRKYYNIHTLEDLKGFGTQNSLLAFYFTIQLFSLAGIPLLAGFLGKAILFYAGVDANLWWLVLIALLNSALSVGYYAIIIKSIYFEKSEKPKKFVEISIPLIAQFILVCGTVIFGVYAGLVINYTI
ncbi:MAG: NADH-quinone oxidoreductase subunit N [Sulfurovum sp.]